MINLELFDIFNINADETAVTRKANFCDSNKQPFELVEYISNK